MKIFYLPFIVTNALNENLPSETFKGLLILWIEIRCCLGDSGVVGNIYFAIKCIN